MAVFFLKFLYLSFCILLSIEPFLAEGEMILFLAIISLFMLVFFLLPIVRWKVIFLTIQTLLIAISLYITNIISIPMMLLHFYILYEGSNYINGRNYLYFIIGVGGLSSFPLFLENITSVITYLLIYCLIASICYKRALIFEERNAFKEMYENLLTEYRKLKRASNDQMEHAKIEERNRIAREIHDSVGHQLTSLMMQLEMSKIMIPNHHEALEALDSAKHIASASLKETRNAVKALKNDSIDGVEAVILLIKKLESDSHLQVKLTTRNRILNVRLTNEESIVLYRSIQECLTNVMRHARTKQVSITLELVAERSIRFIVENPTQDEAFHHVGFGLQSLRDRIEQLGGQVSIGIIDHQFQVSAMLPLKEREL